MKFLGILWAIAWAVQFVALVAGLDTLSHLQQIAASAMSAVLFLQWALDD